MADLPGSSPANQLFKCSCEGENPNCMHCDGAGWTVRPVGSRSAARSSPVRPTKSKAISTGAAQGESFLNAKEREYARMISNEMTRLKRDVVGRSSAGPLLFYAFLQSLFRSVQPGTDFAWAAFLPPLEQAGLKGIAEKFSAFAGDPNWRLRTVARATRECHRAYESALAQKKALALQQQQEKQKQKQSQLRPPKRKKVRLSSPLQNSSAQNATPAPQTVQCGYCSRRIFAEDFEQHHRLFHPELKSVLSLTKPARSVQPPAARTKVRETTVHPPTPPQTRRAAKQSGTSKARTRTLEQPSRNLERARADTGPVERRMDARYGAGGRYRDTDGTFGSYPLHDDMSDESDAG